MRRRSSCFYFTLFAIPALLTTGNLRADPVRLMDGQLDEVVASKGGGSWAYANATATAVGNQNLTNTVTFSSARDTGTASGRASGGASGAAASNGSNPASIEVVINYGINGHPMVSRSFSITRNGIVAYIVAGMTARITVK